MFPSAATTLILLLGGALPTAPAPVPSEANAQVVNISLSARILTIERTALTSVGIDYLLLGNDRVRVAATQLDRRGQHGGRAEVRSATLGITAFLRLLREGRSVRSEATQQIVVLSGSEGRIASLDLHVDRFGARSRGPSLSVAPTLLDDGSIHLRVIARDEDISADRWGGYADGSPVSVATEIVVQPGVETVLGSSSAHHRSTATGLLRLSSSDAERDVLVVITAQPLTPY